MTGFLRKHVDHRIQVTMFDFQFDNTALYIFAVRHGHGGFYYKNGERLQTAATKEKNC